MCFLWKLSQRLVIGYKITWQWSDQLGRYAVPLPLARGEPGSVRRARERSLAVRGARIFNLLPASLQSETWPGRDLARAAASNSLLDQLPLLQLE